MKNNPIFYIASLLLVVSIWACSQSAPDSNTTQATGSTTVKQDPHAGHDHAGHNHTGASGGKVHKASTLAPYIGMWEYTYTVKIRDKEAHKKNEGRWIKFEGDATFVSGRWDKQLNKGTWGVSEDGLLSIDYEDHNDQIDRVWKTQGAGGDVVIWNGTKANNATGTSIKMSKIEAFPVKK